MNSQMTTPTTSIHRRRYLAAAAAVSAMGLAWYALTIGDARFAERGDPNPGRVVGTLDVVGYFVGFGLAAFVFGTLAYVLSCSRTDPAGYIDASVYPAHRSLARAVTLLAVVAWSMVPVSAAEGTGTGVRELMASTFLFEAVRISEKAVAWLVLACCATAMAAVAGLMLKWVSHVVLLVPGSIGAVSLAMAGNAGQGPDHDYNTGLGILFALGLALSFGIRAAAIGAPRLGPTDHLDIIDRRRAWTVLGADAVALAAAAGLTAFLVPWRFLLSTAYGVAALTLLGALAAALVLSVREVRGDRSRAEGRQPLLGALLTLVAIAGWTVMDTRIAPGLLTHPFTGWDVFLGYTLPAAPNTWLLVTVWRFDFFVGTCAIVAGVVYGIGVRRLHKRGDVWPPGRTFAWFSGILLLIVTVSSGVRSYGSAMFSVHMAEHMLLNMFVPVLLVLGAPATLALRALSAAGFDSPLGPREWLLTLLHSRITRFLSNPFVALMVFTLSLYVVYFTPIFPIFIRYHWGHVLLTVHFLLVGYLFFWVVIGIDPGPKRIPHLARVALLFAVMPFHAFFGISLMTMTTVVGDKFYQQLGLPWVDDLLRDQWLGGAVAWGVSEVPALVVVIAIVAQWAKSDTRASRRADRHADRYEDTELQDYNAMLAELQRSRR